MGISNITLRGYFTQNLDRANKKKKKRKQKEGKLKGLAIEAKKNIFIFLIFA